MPPAFALSQDQTLRFIQASLQSPKRPYSNTQTNFQRLITLTKYFPATHKQPSTQPKHPKQAPQKENPPRRRPRIPPRHSTQQGKTHSITAKHPTTQTSSQALSTSKKTRCNCQTTKKNQHKERLNGIPNAGPSTPTNHRQGKQTSQIKPTSQAQKHNNP